MGIRKQCEYGKCNVIAKFFVSQPTIPQQLANGDMEKAPAARSLSVCGRHLSKIVLELGNLPFRATNSLKITIQ